MPSLPTEARAQSHETAGLVTMDWRVWVPCLGMALCSWLAFGDRQVWAVLSPTILRPNPRVRMILPDEERPIRCVAGVAWAAFEMPKSGPRYRAGIEFFDAESGNLDRFIEQNKLPS